MSLLLTLAVWLAVLALSAAELAPSPSPYFNYYTSSSCSEMKSGNIATMLNFAISNPPFTGQCTQCINLCAPRQPNNHSLTHSLTHLLLM